MRPGALPFKFIGEGNAADLSSRLAEIQPGQEAIGPWIPRRGAEGIPDNGSDPEHPANYLASRDLANAVNTALTLAKPLLLTGKPGTGKSQLAERIAWEFNLGPVLRFEAQSTSEANDLFYRFDLVGHLAAVEVWKAKVRENVRDGGRQLTSQESDVALDPKRFLKLGPLGEAIVRSNPGKYHELFDAVFGPNKEWAVSTEPRRSVVLIDEIDKASRDFPNDLLNGIERREFRIPELGVETMTVDKNFTPIVIITSNSERDLPAPFLRRCTFFHIKEPDQPQLRRIIAQRFFSRAEQNAAGTALPGFYDYVLTTFWNFRDEKKGELQYHPGTSELIDLTETLMAGNATPEAIGERVDLLTTKVSSVSKHEDDQKLLITYLNGLKPAASKSGA